MKVTYFNPSQTTITFADTATFGAGPFTYYPGTNPSNTFSSTDCAGLDPDNTNNVNIPNSLVFVRDTRNKQVYKVKKMADNKCWMIDNLKYQGNTDRDGAVIQNYDGVDGGGIPNGTAGSTGLVFRNGRGPNLPTAGTSISNTIDGSMTHSATNTNKAFWNNPMSDAACYSGLYSGNPSMDANTLTHCGYLYNWFAATGGTGNYSLNTYGNQATGSICPANFRLPSAESGTGGPTTNGTGVTEADFPVLNASMDAGYLTTGSTNSALFTNWLPGSQWSGVFSGVWTFSLGSGASGAFWSSTVISPGLARQLFVVANDVAPNVGTDQAYGMAVRCVMP